MPSVISGASAGTCQADPTRKCPSHLYISPIDKNTGYKGVITAIAGLHLPLHQPKKSEAMSAIRSSLTRFSALPRWSAGISRARLAPVMVPSHVRTYKGGPARDVMTGEIIQLPDIDVS